MPDALNLPSAVCQLHLNKTEREENSRWEGRKTGAATASKLTTAKRGSRSRRPEDTGKNAGETKPAEGGALETTCEVAVRIKRVNIDQDLKFMDMLNEWAVALPRSAKYTQPTRIWRRWGPRTCQCVEEAQLVCVFSFSDSESNFFALFYTLSNVRVCSIWEGE